MILATIARNIGFVLAGIVVVGFLVYAFGNYRKARPEVGSEIELAPNRKPYYEDEELETRRLDRTLGMGLVTLAVVAVTLPVYWLAEPGRQADKQEGMARLAETRGEELYTLNCAGCHAAEAVGGVAAYVLTDSDGNFIESVNWKAPALNTVLTRYSKEEVLFVLNYGRPNTPMPPWGAPGGGALTEQQVEEIVEYLESIQLPVEEIRTEVDGWLIGRYVDGRLATDAEAQGVSVDDLDPDEKASLTEEYTTEVEGHLADGDYDYDLDGAWSVAELGQAMFNHGDDGYAGGAYSCARCHTKGWSYGRPEISGGGFLRPNLTGSATLRQFTTFEEHLGFVTEGAQRGQAYGSGGLSGAGQMPGFGFNPNAEDEGSLLVPEQFMYSQSQLEAVVAYERSL